MSDLSAALDLLVQAIAREVVRQLRDDTPTRANEFVDARAAAAEGLLSRRAFLRLAKSGSITSYRHGRTVRVRRADLLAWLGQQSRKPSAAKATDVGDDPIARALESGRLRAIRGGKP